MHPYVNRSTIYNRQEMEMSISRGMHKEEVVHIHNGILLSRKTKTDPTVCHNMDVARG